jgi:hypothetical protein
MTPESHRKICDLYHSVSELAPAERSAFLDKASGGDEALRREVESLLAAGARAGDYFAAPAMGVAAGLLAEENYPSLAGQSFSHYQVLSLIGAGGMGEVYLAEDTRLGRKVALKLLPAQFTQDADRSRRFERKARAASSLNHPNIITIFEVGQVDGRHFICAEYIEGQTLRRRLAGDQLKLHGTLDYRSGDGDVKVHVTRAGAWGACRGAERYLQPWRSALRDDHRATAVRGRDGRRGGCGNPGTRAAAAGAVCARSARRVAADRGEGAA